MGDLFPADKPAPEPTRTKSRWLGGMHSVDNPLPERRLAVADSDLTTAALAATVLAHTYSGAWGCVECWCGAQFETHEHYADHVAAVLRDPVRHHRERDDMSNRVNPFFFGVGLVFAVVYRVAYAITGPPRVITFEDNKGRDEPKDDGRVR